MVDWEGYFIKRTGLIRLFIDQTLVIEMVLTPLQCGRLLRQCRFG